MSVKINWDALGVTASVACAIHCAVLPLILSSFPIFGVEIIDNAFFEYFMIGLAFAIGIYALSHGRNKHHHSWLPMGIFAGGIACLIAKQVWHQWQLWFLLPAVVLIVAAHYINYRLCRSANHCHVEDCAHEKML
jgi:hypothetical protein